MKRTYIIPNVTVVEINSQKLFAISTVNVSSQDYDEETMTDLVRQETYVVDSFWDNEW